MTMQELYDLLKLELEENGCPPDTPIVVRVDGTEVEVWDCWYRNIKYYRRGVWPHDTFVIEDTS